MKLFLEYHRAKENCNKNINTNAVGEIRKLFASSTPRSTHGKVECYSPETRKVIEKSFKAGEKSLVATYDAPISILGELCLQLERRIISQVNYFIFQWKGRTQTEGYLLAVLSLQLFSVR